MDCNVSQVQVMKWRIKRLKTPIIFPLKYALLRNQVLKEFSHFFLVIFSLVFIVTCINIFSCWFLLNYISRLSSCNPLLFRLHLQVSNLVGFSPFFFSLVLTFAWATLLGFQLSKLSLLFFFLLSLSFSFYILFFILYIYI